MATLNAVAEPREDVTRRAERRGWAALLALLIGVGLIAMHTGPSSPTGHAHHPGGHEHSEAASSADGHAPECGAGCSSHSSVLVACTMLLIAAAGGAAIRVARRLLTQSRLHLAAMTLLRTSRAQLLRVALKPPDLHALQVMRC